MTELEDLSDGVNTITNDLYDSFALIYVLCYFNLIFFVTQIIQIIFLKKLDRTYTFPTIGFFSDLTLFVVSAYTLWYIQTEIMLDINVEGVPA